MLDKVKQIIIIIFMIVNQIAYTRWREGHNNHIGVAYSAYMEEHLSSSFANVLLIWRSIYGSIIFHLVDYDQLYANLPANYIHSIIMFIFKFRYYQSFTHERASPW